MEIAVVDPAKGHSEFIADLQSQRARLCKAQMMGIAGVSSTDKARLRGDKAKVGLVAPALRQCNLNQTSSAALGPPT